MTALKERQSNFDQRKSRKQDVDVTFVFVSWFDVRKVKSEFEFRSHQNTFMETKLWAEHMSVTENLL